MSQQIELALPNRRATRRLAALLGAALSPGDLVVLEGDLGAGKTFLVRGICRALDVPSSVRVTSPTFALVHEHQARVPLLHADLYRLGSPDELIELGLGERIGRDAVVLIEWGDRFATELGGEGLWIWLALTADGRSARLEGRGTKGNVLLQKIVQSPGWERLR